MQDENNLSPWAHPKAQRWFATLLERSGFIAEIEDTLQLDDSHFELGHGRMMLALMIMLGRPGIWPDDKKRVLNRAASKVNKLANDDSPKASSGKKPKPLSLDQHQRNAKAKKAVQDEIEIVRRRAGMSNRKSKLPPPETWKGFWC